MAKKPGKGHNHRPWPGLRRRVAKLEVEVSLMCDMFELMLLDLQKVTARNYPCEDPHNLVKKCRDKMAEIIEEMGEH